jgi:PIN domain nuclease of toxin-antitoxin system
MKLLLATHSFIWFVMGSPRLSQPARLLIEDTCHDKYVSSATVWEMAIKHS